MVLRTFELKHYTYLLYALLVGALFQSVLGQLQLYDLIPSKHGLFNITGTFFNPAPFSGYLCCAFPVALFLYLKKRGTRSQSFVKNTISKGRHIFTLVCLLAMVIVLPATRSRAAWLSVLLVGVLVFLQRTSFDAVLRKYHIKKRVAILLISLVALIVLSGVYFVKKDSADGRLLIWQVATHMLFEKPLLGFGDNGFEASYMSYQADFFRQNPEHVGIDLADNVQYAYNELIKLSVEQGVVGAVIILLMAYFVARIRKKRLFLRIAQYGLLSLFVFAMFSYPSAILAIKACGVLFLALASAFASPILQCNGRVSKGIALGLIVALIFILPRSYRGVQDYYQALTTWRDASDIYRVEAYEECLDDFALAHPMLSWNGDFLIQYGKALSMTEKDAEAILILESAKLLLNNTILYTALGDSYTRLGDYNQAELAYWEAYHMVPNRFYPLYLLALMYEQEGDATKAEAIATMIERKLVKVDSRAIEEIKTEMQALKERLALKL